LEFIVPDEFLLSIDNDKRLKIVLIIYLLSAICLMVYSSGSPSVSVSVSLPVVESE